MPETDPSGKRPITLLGPDGNPFTSDNYPISWSQADRERGAVRHPRGGKSYETALAVVGSDGVSLTDNLSTTLENILIELQAAREARELPETQEVQLRPSRNRDIWQLRTLEVEITGITTQTTAYAAVDAVGTGQSVNFGANPNNFIIVHGLVISYDLAPTTSQALLFPEFYSTQVTAQTDNAKLDLTPAEERSKIANFQPTVGAHGGIATDTAGAFQNGGAGATLQPCPTAPDGTLWMQCYANGAFTIASAGRVWIKFIYRYGNFAGFA